MQSSVKLLAVVIASAWAETQFDVWNFDTAELFQTTSQKSKGKKEKVYFYDGDGDIGFYWQDDEATSSAEGGYPKGGYPPSDARARKFEPASDQSEAYKAKTPAGQRAASYFLGDETQNQHLVVLSGYSSKRLKAFESSSMAAVAGGLIAATGPAAAFVQTIAPPTVAKVGAASVVAAKGTGAVGALSGVTGAVCAFGPAAICLAGGLGLGLYLRVSLQPKKPDIGTMKMNKRIGIVEQFALPGEGRDAPPMKPSMAITESWVESVVWCFQQAVIQIGENTGLYTANQMKEAMRTAWPYKHNFEEALKEFEEHFKKHWEQLEQWEKDLFDIPGLGDALKLKKFAIHEAMKATALAHGINVDEVINAWDTACLAVEFIGEASEMNQKWNDLSQTKGDKISQTKRIEFISLLTKMSTKWLIKGYEALEKKANSNVASAVFLGVNKDILKAINEMEDELLFAIIACLASGKFTPESVLATLPEGTIEVREVQSAFLSFLGRHYDGEVNIAQIKEFLDQFAETANFCGLRLNFDELDQETTNDVINAVVGEAWQLLQAKIKNQGS